MDVIADRITRYLKIFYPRLHDGTAFFNPDENAIEISYPMLYNCADIRFNFDKCKNFVEYHIFKNGTRYLKLRKIALKIKKFITFKFDVEYLDYSSYFDIIPAEILAKIANVISAMCHPTNITNYLEIINVSETFDNMWKLANPKNYFNPNSMNIINHPLIQNFCKKFIILVYNTLYSPKLKLILVDNYILFRYMVYQIGYKDIVKIDVSNFNVHDPTNNIILGSLCDSPWYGFDLIDKNGLINRRARHTARLKELKKIN